MTSPQSAADLKSEAAQRMVEVDYYGAVLRELVDIGLGLARTLQFEVASRTQAHVGEGDGSSAADAIPAFERVARSVRYSIALARSLGDPEARRVGPSARIAARVRIIREVEDRITRQCGSSAVESLRGELRERLEQPELDDDIGSRPVEDIIAEICRDLGIAEPPGPQRWLRRTPADVVALRDWAALPERDVAVTVVRDG